MRCKKWAPSAGALLMLLCSPFATSWCWVLMLEAPGWKEKILNMREPSREQWLASWSKAAKLHAQCHRNWLNSPQLAAETTRRFSGDILVAFGAHVYGVGVAEQFLNKKTFLWEIEHACSHALGGDIVLELLGSTARGTGLNFIDGDMDIQVSRRPGSGRAHEPFTDTDKRRVAQNLEKLDFISDVTIGNIAIKFAMTAINVDLVLWKERSEEFPALRGGSTFYNNSKRINAFLDQSPIAKQAIIAIKTYFARGRPKGLLLEAIAWRLGSMKLELKTILRRVKDAYPKSWGPSSFSERCLKNSGIGNGHLISAASFSKTWLCFRTGRGPSTLQASRKSHA
ncbi:unnamed protein product [Symbiodinium sp. CCMP2456]|nr:unnamed protein product [Symbiodinium sp. CCMP2456]